MANTMKIISERVENIGRKGENVRYQHFSPLPTMSSSLVSFLRINDIWNYVAMDKPIPTRQNFGPDQIESRQQIKCNKNDNFCL